MTGSMISTRCIVVVSSNLENGVSVFIKQRKNNTVLVDASKDETLNNFFVMKRASFAMLSKTGFRLVCFVFPFLYLGLCVFSLWNLMQAPIQQGKYVPYIALHLKSSPLEILLFKHHRQIRIYKNLLSNFLYQKFSVTEITYRDEINAIGFGNVSPNPISRSSIQKSDSIFIFSMLKCTA